MTNKEIHLETERFILKNLTADDATLQYLGWLCEQSDSGFIVSAKQNRDINDLRQYIEVREAKKDVVFLGIFTRNDGFHIGNIKYEPINQALKYAVMGIMIGEKGWQGKGVAAEAINSSAKWLHKEFGIDEIVLGVDLRNGAAIRAYERAGFSIQETDKISVDGESAISMVLCLKDSG